MVPSSTPTVVPSDALTAMQACLDEEDMACIPYGSEKSDIPLTGRFGSRFRITVEVINPSTGATIETMSSDFLNW